MMTKESSGLYKDCPCDFCEKVRQGVAFTIKVLETHS